MRAVLIWAALAVALAAPLALAAASPLLAWRQPVYVAAGVSGVAALGLMLVQPLLAAGALPGLSAPRARRAHAWLGAALLGAVAVHVGGLWVASPPDVVDALTFTSPTPFSDWGVAAMWALVAAAVLAARRRRLPPRLWRFGHRGLVAAAVAGTVVHALLIEGTMETVSKLALCALVLAALGAALSRRRAWR